MIQSSPSRTERVRRPARSEPARGLGEELAPDLLAGDGPGHVALLLGLGGVGHHGRDAHAQADLEVAAGDEEAGLLLVVDHLHDGRLAPPAVLLGPGERGQPGLGLLALELLGAAQALRASPQRAGQVSKEPALGSALALEEAPALGAEGGFLGRVARSPWRSPSQPAPRASRRAMSRSFQVRALPRREGQELGAAIVHVAVELPGEAHAAVGLDVLLGGEEEGLGGADPRGGGGHRQLGEIGGEGPRGVVGVGARQLQGDVDVDQLVLDGLERGDGAPEGEAPQRVLAGHVERGLGAAHLLEGDQDGGAVEDALGQRPAFAGRAERLGGGALEARCARASAWDRSSPPRCA